MPFQHANGVVKWLAPGLTKKQMDMFGHENVSEQVKLVPLPDAFEDVKENCAGTIAIQVRQATMTTESEEVVMAFGLVSLEVERHPGMIARKDSWKPTHAQRTRMNGAPGTRHPAQPPRAPSLLLAIQTWGTRAILFVFKAAEVFFEFGGE